MRSRIDRVSLEGFKTIAAMESFPLGPLTVLIGPNGVGKSNFISFFRMIGHALADPDNFPSYVSGQGGASKLLRNGPRQTSLIRSEITLASPLGEDKYAFALTHSRDDRFIFTEEAYSFGFIGLPNHLPWFSFGEGNEEPRLPRTPTPTAIAISSVLKSVSVFQFHDTSSSSPIRNRCNLNDDHMLKEDGGNLPAILWRMKQSDPGRYQRILGTLRLILPYISDFQLEPTGSTLLLRWTERGSDEVFTVSQASDGMLRILALVTLLLQRQEDLPHLLILDEPELGLHPYALNIIGGLIDAASSRSQVMVATQSSGLVDCFEPENVVIVERTEIGSDFSRLSSGELEAWLEDYSLSELWEKNVLGGRP